MVCLKQYLFSSTGSSISTHHYTNLLEMVHLELISLVLEGIDSESQPRKFIRPFLTPCTLSDSLRFMVELLFTICVFFSIIAIILKC